MFLLKAKPRLIKDCFLLADALKSGPFDWEAFRNTAALERQKLANMPESEIDEKINKDPGRLNRYNQGKWDFTVIELASCSVCPGMDNRNWATGPVNQVAERLKKQSDSANKAWAILKFVSQPFSEVPLIVFRRKSNPAQFRIDDGCHRAVAYFLAGFRQAFAYVGTFDGKHKLLIGPGKVIKYTRLK